MEPSKLTDGERAQIRTFLTQEGVHDSYEVFVVRHATEPDSTWRWCCGSNCDPCVRQLGRAVDRTRRLLDLPTGLPGPGEQE